MRLVRLHAVVVQVDEFSRTSVPSVWAVGDATNRVNLTPVALMEGMAFARSCFGGELTKPDYNFIPCAVFSQPPLASGVDTASLGGELVAPPASSPVVPEGLSEEVTNGSGAVPVDQRLQSSRVASQAASSCMGIQQ